MIPSNIYKVLSVNPCVIVFALVFLRDSFPSPDRSIWFAVVASPPFEVFVLLSGYYNEDIFNLGASAAAMKFCGWIQFRADVYIPY